MFLRKKYRELDYEISRQQTKQNDDTFEINIKVEDKDQVFSQYDYDNNEKLKLELSDFIYDKAKYAINQDIKIKIHSKGKINHNEVKDAIKNHYKKEYIETKQLMKRNLVFSVVMFGLGLLALTFLLVMNAFFYNEYMYIISEIVTWVFVWEAVDSFFLERSSLKRKRITFLKLYSAQIEFVSNEKID